MHAADTAALRDQIETLREENRQLRDLLVPPGTLPSHWRLTRYESRIVRALAAGNGVPVCVERLIETVYGGGCDQGEASIRVAVCKIRRKHDAHGLTVETLHGFGYAMTPESCTAVREALARPSPKTLRDDMWAGAPIGAPAAAA